MDMVHMILAPDVPMALTGCAPMYVDPPPPLPIRFMSGEARLDR